MSAQATHAMQRAKHLEPPVTMITGLLFIVEGRSNVKIEAETRDTKRPHPKGTIHPQYSTCIPLLYPSTWLPEPFSLVSLLLYSRPGRQYRRQDGAARTALSARGYATESQTQNSVGSIRLELSVQHFSWHVLYIDDGPRGADHSHGGRNDA